MNVVNDLLNLSKRASNLREQVLRDDLVIKATKEQEDSFYKNLKDILIKTQKYKEQYEKSIHVINLDQFLIHVHRIYNNEDISFNLGDILNQLEQMYSERQSFIPGAYTLVLFPIRLIIEKMYRDLIRQPYDKKFNDLFDEVDKV